MIIIWVLLLLLVLPIMILVSAAMKKEGGISVDKTNF